MPYKNKISLAEQGRRMKPEDFAKYSARQGNLDQLRKIYMAMRASYGKRVSSFKRADLYSHAQTQYEMSRSTADNGRMKDYSRNQLIAEIVRLQNFFNAESSTLAGIRRLNYEQDVRLFGVVPGSTEPRYRMTNDQRKRFWNLFNEYSGSSAFTQFASSQVQNALVDLMVGPESQDFNNASLTERLNMLEQRSKQVYEQSERGGSFNVYSGRRTNQQ